MACGSCHSKRTRKILPPLPEGPVMKTIWYAISPSGEAVPGPTIVKARQKARAGGGSGWTIVSRREPVEV